MTLAALIVASIDCALTVAGVTWLAGRLTRLTDALSLRKDNVAAYLAGLNELELRDLSDKVLAARRG